MLRLDQSMCALRTNFSATSSSSDKRLKSRSPSAAAAAAAASRFCLTKSTNESLSFSSALSVRKRVARWATRSAWRF